MRCLDGRPGEIVVLVKTPGTRGGTERPHGALLQFDIECLCHMYRIGRSLRDRNASFDGMRKSAERAIAIFFATDVLNNPAIRFIVFLYIYVK